MIKVIKLVKSLIAKGFATSEEKAQVVALVKELSDEEAEAVQSDVEAVAKLSETDPNASADEAELEKNVKAIFARSAKSIKEEVLSDVKSEVSAYFKAQKEALAKSSTGEKSVAEKRKATNSYLRKFVSAVINHDSATLKELTTDATGSPYGGYVVDSELSAEIRHLMTEYGVARSEMTTVQLSKGSYKANDLVTDVTVSWVDQASAIPSTQVVLGQESLTLEKLGAIVTLTRELLEDGEIDLFSFIAGRVAEGFANKEDAAFFTGEGTGDTANAEFEGVLYATGANSVTLAGTTFASMTADDLLDMQDESPQSIARNGKYYMHRSVRNLVRKLKDDQNNYIYQNPSETGPALIWGRPVVEVEVMPSVADSDTDTPFVVYGDLKKACILGYKGAISADRFNAGIIRNVANNADINLITTDREAVRWVERVGYITILPSAVTVLKTAAGS